MIFGKEATKTPSEHNGSDEAGEHDDCRESGIHRGNLVRFVTLRRDQFRPLGLSAVVSVAMVVSRRFVAENEDANKQGFDLAR